MTWYKSNQPDLVLLRARAEFDGDPDAVGDARMEILPGETVAGLSYERWRALPDGPLSIRFEAGRPVAVEAVTLPETPS